MALKSKDVKEVKHLLLSNTIDELDKTITLWINNGWYILDSRVVQVDHANQYYVVFYIFARGTRLEE